MDGEKRMIETLSFRRRSLMLTFFKYSHCVLDFLILEPAFYANSGRLGDSLLNHARVICLIICGNKIRFSKAYFIMHSVFERSEMTSSFTIDPIHPINVFSLELYGMSTANTYNRIYAQTNGLMPSAACRTNCAL